MHNRDHIYILGYCPRGFLLRRFFEDNDCKNVAFIEIIGNNKNKDNVISLEEVDHNCVVIVALKRRHFNDTIPKLLNTGFVKDIYFLSIDDILMLESYNTNFEGNNMERVYPSRYIARNTGRVLLEELYKKFQFKSVIDFGCGSGAYLAAARDINDRIKVHGLDGCRIDRNEFVQNDCVEIVDLEKYEYSNVNERYDVAISIEVAEHLSTQSADLLVDNLCNASDVVVFSAAIPYQSGDGHINCQWQTYWAEKFVSKGYKPIDFFRKTIWNRKDCLLHCRQNTILYVKLKSNRSRLFDGESTIQLDLVHPEMLKLLLSELS